MLSRSFHNLGLDGAKGSWTMLAKVKPSDPNDEKYYVATNQHVKRVFRNFYDLSKPIPLVTTIGKFVNYNNSGGLSPLILESVDKSKPLVTPFWGFTKYKKRWDNEEKTLGVTRFVRDMQISIMDLKNVYAAIDKALLEETRSAEKEKLKILKADFEKWKTFAPLEFTDRYKNIISSSVYLDDLILTGYTSGSTSTSTARKFKTQDGNNILYRGEGEYIIAGGGSGSLVVSRDRKIVAIHNEDPGIGGFWRQGQFFYSKDYDSIGSNVDGSNPTENNNPTTFAKAVIEGHRQYPNSYDLLDIFKNKN